MRPSAPPRVPARFFPRMRGVVPTRADPPHRGRAPRAKKPPGATARGVIGHACETIGSACGCASCTRLARRGVAGDDGGGGDGSGGDGGGAGGGWWASRPSTRRTVDGIMGFRQFWSDGYARGTAMMQRCERCLFRVAGRAGAAAVAAVAGTGRQGRRGGARGSRRPRPALPSSVESRGTISSRRSDHSSDKMRSCGELLCGGATGACRACWGGVGGGVRNARPSWAHSLLHFRKYEYLRKILINLSYEGMHVYLRKNSWKVNS